MAQPPGRVHPQPRRLPRAGWKRGRPRSPTAPSLPLVPWPFFDLRIRSGDVVLRGVSDDDIEPLLAALPADLELDPRLESFPSLAEDRDRREALRVGLLAPPGPVVAVVVVSRPRGGARRRGGRRPERSRATTSPRCAPSTPPRGWPPTCAGVGSPRRCAPASSPSPSITWVRSSRSPRPSTRQRRLAWPSPAGWGTPTTGSGRVHGADGRRRPPVPQALPGDVEGGRAYGGDHRCGGVPAVVRAPASAERDRAERQQRGHGLHDAGSAC